MPNRAWSFYPHTGNRIAAGSGNYSFVVGQAYVGPQDSSGLGVVALAVLGPSVQAGGIVDQLLIPLIAGTGIAILAITVLLLKRKRSA
jgi:hypothetical protein